MVFWGIMYNTKYDHNSHPFHVRCQSVPYGYPTGAGLRTKICKEFPTALKDLVNRETRSSGGTSAAAMDAHRTAKDFADAFKDSNTRSIDLYLARNPHLADFGEKGYST